MDPKPVVLFVDDERSMRVVYQHHFKDKYEVITASDGKEALQILEERQGKVDLIVLDIRMEEMSGLETLQEMVKRNYKIPVILYTAYASYQDDYLSWFADAYIVKSSDITELEKEIEKILNERGTK